MGVTREKQVEDESGCWRGFEMHLIQMHLSTPLPTWPLRRLPWQPPQQASPAPVMHKLLNSSLGSGLSELTLSESGGLPDQEPINSAGIATGVEGEGAPQVLDVAVLWSQAWTLQRDVPGCRANHCPP